MHDEAAVGARDTDVLAAVDVDAARSWLDIQLGCGAIGAISPPGDEQEPVASWRSLALYLSLSLSLPLCLPGRQNKSAARTVDLELALDRVIPLRLLLDGRR